MDRTKCSAVFRNDLLAMRGRAGDLVRVIGDELWAASALLAGAGALAAHPLIAPRGEAVSAGDEDLQRDAVKLVQTALEACTNASRNIDASDSGRVYHGEALDPGHLRSAMEDFQVSTGRCDAAVAMLNAMIARDYSDSVLRALSLLEMASQRIDCAGNAITLASEANARRAA